MLILDVSLVARILCAQLGLRPSASLLLRPCGHDFPMPQPEGGSGLITVVADARRAGMRLIAHREACSGRHMRDSPSFPQESRDSLAFPGAVWEVQVCARNAQRFHVFGSRAQKSSPGRVARAKARQLKLVMVRDALN
ncbi:unnamed protein product [Effrenium voratum]|nr:unnamed protein product [Effrenium voratum]